MKLFYLFFVFISFNTEALTCVVTDEMQSEDNRKYGDKLSIETRLKESNYIVEIKLPQKIDNGKIKNIALFADSVKEPTFFAPLETFEEDGNILTWYSIDSGFIRKHFIVVSFGDDCGSSIIKEVIYA
ncbi:hypothetical protein MHM98_04755 [Psychrobium sp. MM17-31]|uniref:hypothetical protein n=1 Tax=Psychrobium sp. MM17-31 TaxID=2917758 RepID=UPI001EF3F0DC|nr:hypothetical protein [Psychrobium sp. MM17-31]MCG7530667.1 hypothetical protein [Psychrobium sp. MM17-31]